MSWEWLAANFLTVVLPVGLAVLGIIGGIVVALTFYLKSKKSLGKLRIEVMEGLVALSKGEMPVYQDGLPELEDKKKLRLIRDGLKARKKFKYNKAIKKFQKALTRATIPSERCAVLSLIGLSQGKSGATRDAEKTFLEVISIAEQAKIEEALAVAYGNIGVVYLILGESHKAVGYHQKALEISEKVGSLEGQASQLANIGNVHYTLGEFRKALEYYEKSLKITEQIGNIEVQAQILGNIGVIYATLDEPQKALGYQQKALGLAEKIGNFEIQAKALGNMGIVYQTLGEPHKAFEYLEKALEIDEKIGNLEGQAEELANIGAAYGNMGNHQNALGYFQRARELFVKIGAKHMVADTDHKIAIARQKLAEKKK